MPGTRRRDEPTALVLLAGALLMAIVLVAAAPPLTDLLNGASPAEASPPPDVAIVTDADADDSRRLRIVLQSGTATLADLHDALVQEDQPQVLRRVGDAWLLEQTLEIAPGARLEVTGTELRLRSDAARVVGLEARGGDLLVEDSRIVSWDVGASAPDEDVDNRRAWVLARDGARFDVIGSQLAMLGYDADERFGVAWRTAGTDGEIRDSAFTGNFYGAYFHGVEPMEITGSVFELSHRYGLDPHTRSRGFTITDNVFRYNGRHGLILAVDCTDAHVAGNHAYGNQAHGIVVFSGSDRARLVGNEVHDNGGNGIDVNDSSHAVLVDNVVYANGQGVAVDHASRNVELRSNRISANLRDGVRVSTGGEVTAFRDNLVYDNLRAGVFIDDGRAVVGGGNDISRNDIGVWISSDAVRSVVTGNQIYENVLDGVHLDGPPAADVVDNRIVDNGKAAFSVTAAGDAAALVGRNDAPRQEDGQEIERVRATSG